ncbi:MAG: two-component regulator propeller domain-containing protein [Anaerolineae bacterium]
MRRLRWLALVCALFISSLITARAGADTPAVWSTTTNADEVNALAIQGNSLWAATEGGVVRWDLAAGSAAVYTIDHGLPSNQARSIAIDPTTGYVWAGTMGGIARWDGSAWRSWDQSQGLLVNRVDGVGIDGAGHIWATTSYGASVWDGAAWQAFGSMQDAIAAHYADVRASTVPTTIWAIENGSVVWTTVGPGDGVHAYDGTTWRDYDSTTTPAMPADLIDAVMVTGAGVRWFGTSGGAARWRPDGAPQVMGADKLPAKRVRALSADVIGRMWLAAYSCTTTCAGGVARVDDRGTADVSDDIWLTIAPSAGKLPSSDVRAVLSTPDGATWFATAIGIARLAANDATWTQYKVGGLPSNQVNALLRDYSGVVWAGTDRGLGRLEAGQWTVYTGQSEAHLPSDNVRAVLQVGTDVWVGTGENRNGQPIGGLTRQYQSGAWANYGVDGSGLPGNVVGLATVSNSTRLWAATQAWNSTPSRLVTQQNGQWISWVDGQNANLGNVRGIAASGTQVWLATESGVRMLDHHGTPSDTGGDWSTFTNASTGGGLASDYATAIGVDSFNRVWVATAAGVSARTPIANATESQRWKTYTPANTGGGLASTLIRGIVVEGPQVWFLHDKGASRYDTYAQQWRNFSRPADSATMNTFSTARETFCSRWFGTSSGLQYLAFDDCALVEPTITPFPTATATLPPTLTPTPTATATLPPTATATATATSTFTPTPSATPTNTRTLTPSPSPTGGEGGQTPTPSETWPPTKTPTATRTATPTDTPSPSPTEGDGGETPTPSETWPPTKTPTPTRTPTESLTPSPAPTDGTVLPPPTVYQVFLPYLGR